MNFKNLSFRNFLPFFVLLFSVSILLFPSCEGEDDDDEYGEYGEHDDDDDDEYGGQNSLMLVLCTADQLIAEVDRINITDLAVAEIPAGVRSYIASEFPAMAIKNVISFNDKTDLLFYEVALNNSTSKLLFDDKEEFICGYE